MQITNQEVEKIAKLARIKLSPEEIEKFSNQLGDILNYINQLDEIETRNVKPTAQITDLINVMRVDKIKLCENTEKLVSAAPKSKDGQIKVKSIL